jgi:GntR family transcriptional regulator
MPRSPHLPERETSLPTGLVSGVGKATQLRDLLETMIAELGPGRLLPSERAVAARLGLARGTVRQVFDRLVVDGLVDRRPGGGTYTAAAQTEHVQMMTSFSNEIRARGGEPRSVVLAAVVEQAPPRIARGLGLPEGSQVFRLERLRKSDETPMAVERVSLPMPRFAGIEKLDWSVSSLAKELERCWGVTVVRQRTSVTAANPGATDAKLLDIPRHQACLALDGTSWDAEDNAIEVERSLYRGDRYDVVTHTHRAGS